MLAPESPLFAAPQEPWRLLMHRLLGRGFHCQSSSLWTVLMLLTILDAMVVCPLKHLSTSNIMVDWTQKRHIHILVWMECANTHPKILVYKSLTL